MPDLFVAGPRAVEEVREFVTGDFQYPDIVRRLESYGYKVTLPTDQLAVKNVGELWERIQQRIERADAVFSFIGRRGTSTIIESGYAAHVHRKPQLIVTDPEHFKSRILRALPDATVIEGKDYHRVFKSCIQAVERGRTLQRGWLDATS